jgi:hypothetical protein
MVLKEGDVQPGDCISCDHFMSPVTGRAIADSGYSSTRHGYTCGTIYVDHASGFMYACCQKSISAEDTIRGKLLFEQEAADSGVTIQKYHSDNGVFSSKQFKAHCKLLKQKLTFSGVGAKFQNGVAENAIKTVCNMARANMLHATMQWPGFSFLDLWPFAIAYAIWVHNHLPPSGVGWSPEELGTGRNLQVHPSHAPTSLAVLFMFWILSSKMAKPFLSGIAKLAKASSLASLLIIRRVFLSFLTRAPNTFRHNIMSYSTMTSQPSRHEVTSSLEISSTSDSSS